MSFTSSASGLGIDFGSDASHSRHTHRQSQGFASDSSASNVTRPRTLSLQPNRRPGAAEEKRRVRIASGQPGILGHATDSTDAGDASSSLASPSSDDSPATSASSSPESNSGVAGRTERLHAAVGALEHGGRAGRGAPTSSQTFDSSPEPTSSAAESSSSSRGSSLLARKATVLRKQASQPSLSRESALRGQVQPLKSAMVRSKSSTSLSSQYSSGTTLGRSREIPRRGSRQRLRPDPSSAAEAPDPRRQTWGHPASSHPVAPEQADQRAGVQNQQSREVVADGFGGFVSRDREEYQRRLSMSTQSTKVVPLVPASERSSPTRQPMPPAQRQVMPPAQRQVMPPPRQSSAAAAPSVAAPQPGALRVGSFYGASGAEVAFLDDDGRITESAAGSRAASSFGGRRGSESAASSAPSHARSRTSSNGPRAHLMASPHSTALLRTTSEGAAMTTAAAAAHAATAPSSTMSGDEASRRAAAAARPGIVKMRSVRGWRGLEGAERGEAMISLDQLNGEFSTGEEIVPGRIRTADEASILHSAQPDHSVSTDDKRGSVSSGVSSSEVGPNDSASNVGGAGPFHRLASSLSGAPPPPNSRRRSLSEAALGNATLLERNGTLISETANPARRSRDLTRLLAGSGGKLGSSSASSSAGEERGSSIVSSSGGRSAKVASARSRSQSVSAAAPPPPPPPVLLEQGRNGKARVDVDIVLESDLVVEGGTLTGRLELRVHRGSSKEGDVMLAQPKIRVVGFEELLNDDTRHIFYHHACVIDGDRSNGGPSEPYILHGSPDLSSPQAEGKEPLACFASVPDHEGYCLGKQGHHSLPFSLELPVGKGAKGSFRGKHALVRYIVIGSVKLKNLDGSQRSIAHFYRHVELHPYLNPAVVLSSAPRLIQATSSKGLFLGGAGKVYLRASLHRAAWVAGQRVYVNVCVNNQTNKKIKSLAMALVRVVTLYRPRPELDLGAGVGGGGSTTEAYVDPDACSTSTSRKKIAEETLELGQKGTKGVVTAKGWWTGVEAGGSVDFSHYMTLPSDALTISRGRHVEVLYFVRVSVGSSLSSDVSVELPLRVVNFVSLDPPPIKTQQRKKAAGAGSGAAMASSWSSLTNVNRPANATAAAAATSSSSSEAPMIDRVRSMDALSSPTKVGPTIPQLGQPRFGRPLPLPHLAVPPREAGGAQEDAIAAQNRRLQHQKSLDFINHAIRSATARRKPSNEPSPLGLGIEVLPPAQDAGLASDASRPAYGGAGIVPGPDATHPSCAPYVHPPFPPAPAGGVRPGEAGMPMVHVNSIALDDAEDLSDEEDPDEYEDDDPEGGGGDEDDEECFISKGGPVNLNDDSIAEVDSVIGSARLDAEDRPRFSHSDHDEGEPDSDSSLLTDSGASMVEEGDDSEADARRHIDREESFRRNVSGMPNPFRSSAHSQDAGEDVDDAPTPLAKSPSRMEATQRPRRVLQQEDLSPRSLPTPPRHKVASSSSSPAREPPRGNGCAGSGGTRPISPSKAMPSPKKSALKTKSSFSFATSATPLKANLVSVEQASPHKGLNKGNGAGTGNGKDSGQRGLTVAQPRARETAAAARTAPQAPPSSTAASEDESSDEGTPTMSHGSSSPGAPESVSTPESLAEQFSLRAQGQEPSVADGRDQGQCDKNAPSMVTSATTAQVVAKRPSNDALLRHSVSASSLQDEGTLRRRESAHTLRGANIVIPSVRDKIAMLESRRQALRDFTAGNNRGADAAEASPVTTPTRAGGGASATEAAGGDGSGMTRSTSRVLQLAAKCEANKRSGTQAAAPTSSPRNGGGTGAGTTTKTGSGNPSRPNLTRRDSTASIDTSLSTQTGVSSGRYAPSVISFRAPVFRQ